MSPDDTNRPPPPSPSSSSAQGPSGALTPRPSSSSTEAPRRGRPSGTKTETIDDVAVKRSRAQGAAEDQRIEDAEKQARELMEKVKKDRARRERERKREQRELAKKVAAQGQRDRKRFIGAAVEVLEELESTEHGRKAWDQIRPLLKSGSRAEEAFMERRKHRAALEALKP